MKSPAQLNLGRINYESYVANRECAAGCHSVSGGYIPSWSVLRPELQAAWEAAAQAVLAAAAQVGADPEEASQR